MTTTNRRWLVNGDPRGRALALSDWIVDEEPLEPLTEGQVRVKTEILAYQPAMKGQMEVIPGYSSGSPIGTVMGSPGVGEVVESAAPQIEVGSKVVANVGWQEYGTLPAKQVQVVPDDDLLSARLGILGASGLTAYFGLLKIGQPEAGDTVVVSGAAVPLRCRQFRSETAVGDPCAQKTCSEDFLFAAPCTRGRISFKTYCDASSGFGDCIPEAPVSPCPKSLLFHARVFVISCLVRFSFL